MRSFTKVLLACSAALAFTVTSAAADVVCNDEGDCWHVKAKQDYKPEFKVHVYGDDWKWGETEKTKYRWREHDGDGRGYWNKGLWIGF